LNFVVTEWHSEINLKLMTTEKNKKKIIIVYFFFEKASLLSVNQVLEFISKQKIRRKNQYENFSQVIM